MITWVQRRGQIKHLLYEMCLTGRIDKATLAEQFKDLNSVEPVKHGRWILKKHPLFDELIHYCSVCGVPSFEYKYCPHCGAKMDKEDSDG